MLIRGLFLPLLSILFPSYVKIRWTPDSSGSTLMSGILGKVLEFRQQIGPGNLTVLCLIMVEVVGLLWLFPYLPMTDLPEHMLQANILAHYDAPGMHYADFFSKKFPWNPYSSYFWFVYSLSRIACVISATRLYIALSLMSTILAFAFWLRNAAPAHLAQLLPGTLLLFGFFFYLGAVNFLFSIPFLFLSLAAAEKICSRPETDHRLEALLCFALLGAYFSHVFTFVLAVLSIGWQCFLCRRGRQMISILRGSLLPLTISVIYLASQAAADTVSVSWTYEPLIARFEKLLLPFNAFRDAADNRWVFQPEFVSIWIAVFVLLIAGTIGVTGKLARKPEWRRPLPALCLFAGASVLLPSFFSNGMPFAMRAAYPAAFCLLAMIPPGWARNRALRAAMYVACLGAPLLLAYRLAGFQQEVRELQQVITAIPKGKVLQPVITEPQSSFFQNYPFLHAAAWYNFVRGGTSPYLFSKQPHFPVREKKSPIVSPPGEWQMNQFKYSRNQAGTEFFLVRTSRQDILEDLGKHVPLFAEAGGWRVFGPNPSH